MEKLNKETLIAQADAVFLNNEVSNDEINLLAEAVMSYMMQTGTDLINENNLYANISFYRAKVYSFEIRNDFGEYINLDKYIPVFEAQLIKNRSAGIKRLIPELCKRHNTTNS